MGRAALLAGLLLVALAPWGGGPAPRARAAGPTATASGTANLFGCLVASYPVGTQPFSVAVGDFNKDGKSDLVTANTPNTVSVLLGNGDGTFQSQQTYAVGPAPQSVAVGDFNGDGKQDLAVANSSFDNSTVSVLLNGGPCLTSSPTNGYPTKHITLSGYNYGPGEGINVYWDSPSTPPLTGTTTDATGAFSATTRVPLAPYGTHLLIGVGQSSGISATTTFQVMPIIALAPTLGVSGTLVTARGAGFGASETVTLYWNGFIPIVLGTTTTSAKGSFGGPSAVTFAVPPSTPGVYRVCAKGQTTFATGCAKFTVTG